MSKIDITKISTAVGGGFLIDFFMFSENIAISRNLNHDYQRKIQIKNFQTIRDMLFLQLTVFTFKFDRPKVKQNLLSGTRSFVC